MVCHAPPFALAVLAEATRISPHRRTTSDGTCASPAHHTQNPSSDHEPSGPHSYCHAVDISQSTPGSPYWAAGHGVFDAHAYGWQIAQRMKAGLERRVKYLVSFDGHHDVIFDPAVSMTWRENGTGTEHANHLHVSFTVGAELSTVPLFGGPAPQEDDLPLNATDLGHIRDIVRQEIDAKLDRKVGDANVDGGLIDERVAHVFGGYPDGRTYRDGVLTIALREQLGLSKKS